MFLFLKFCDLPFKLSLYQTDVISGRRLLENKTVETFIGVPVSYRNSTPFFSSNVHCVGENFDWNTSWMHRSCRFRNLCYDIKSKEFLVFLSPEEIELQELLNSLSNKYDEETISISSNTRDHHFVGIKKLSVGTVRDPSIVDPWFPTVVKDEVKRNQYLSSGFYQLPENTILFPVLLSSKRSVVWEDFFSIYTALSMFGFEDKRLVLINQDRDFEIASILMSFFGIQSSDVGHVLGNSPPSVFHEKGKHVRSNLVCAMHGMAGLGTLAQLHLEKKSVLDYEDQILTQSINHGATMYSFRDFIFNNMDMTHDISKSSMASTKLKITIAFDGSLNDDWHESLRLNLEQREAFADFAVQKIDINKQLRNLLELAATSMAYVSQPGSDTLLAAATCLPRGSILIVLDDRDPTVNESTDGTQELGRTYLEKASYFNLHWIHKSPQDKTGQGIYETVAEIVISKRRHQHAQ